MSNLFNFITKTSYKLAFKYRNGHHVQSPFLYNYFTDVLYNSYNYYFLEKIRQKYKSKSLTTNEIIFKTAAFIDASNIAEINAKNTLTSLYLFNENRNIELKEYSPNKGTIKLFNDIKNKYNLQVIQNNQGIDYSIEDLIIINSFDKEENTINYLKKIQETSNKNSILIVTDINKNRKKIIRDVKELKKITAIIDTYNALILFNKPDLENKYYKINSL